MRRQFYASKLCLFPTLLDSERHRRFNARVSLDKLTIVGAGLLGGSLGLAAKERGLAVVPGFCQLHPEMRQNLAVSAANNELSTAQPL